MKGFKFSSLLVWMMAISFGLTIIFSFGTQGYCAEKVKIGGLFEESGLCAPYGTMPSMAFKMAVHKFNQKGGIKIKDDTYLVEGIQHDVQTVPRESVAALTRLLTQDKVSVLFGPICSLDAAPLASILKQHGTLWFAPCTFMDTVVPDNKFFFKTIGLDGGPGGYAEKVAKYMAEKTNIKTIVTLMQNDDAGKRLNDAWIPQFEKFGIKNIQTILYEPNTTDFGPQLIKIKELKPDCLHFGYTDEAAKMIVRQSLELGVTKSFVSSRHLVQAAMKYKDQIDDFIAFVNKDFEFDPSEKVKIFLKEWQEFFGKPPEMTQIQHAAYVYDWIAFLLKAMQRAGTVTDNDKIADAVLSSPPYDGVWTVKVNEQGFWTMPIDIFHIHKGKITLTKGYK